MTASLKFLLDNSNICVVSVLSSVQSLPHVQLFVTPQTAARQASLSITNFWSLLNLMSIESLTPSNHLILCHPHFLLPSIFPSIKVFSNESVLRIRWPKYWSFNFSISPCNEYLGLISFRMDWLDLPAVPGTLQSLLQHHSSKHSSLSVGLCRLSFLIKVETCLAVAYTVFQLYPGYLRHYGLRFWISFQSISAGFLWHCVSGEKGLLPCLLRGGVEGHILYCTSMDALDG